jgi:hypothetical protein
MSYFQIDNLDHDDCGTLETLSISGGSSCDQVADSSIFNLDSDENL